MKQPFGIPETHEEVRAGNFVELWNAAFLRGFSVDMICRIYGARVTALGGLVPFRSVLVAIGRGEFDYLLRDSSGQSYS